VAYNRLLVRPLGRLTQDIDAMQHGRFSHNPSRSQPMRISELENIRRSLHDYQLQLRELHARWNTRTANSTRRRGRCAHRLPQPARL